MRVLVIVLELLFVAVLVSVWLVTVAVFVIVLHMLVIVHDMRVGMGEILMAVFVSMLLIGHLDGTSLSP